MSENDLKMTQEKWECELMEEQVEQLEEKLVQLKKDLSEAEAVSQGKDRTINKLTRMYWDLHNNSLSALDSIKRKKRKKIGKLLIALGVVLLIAVLAAVGIQTKVLDVTVGKWAEVICLAVGSFLSGWVMEREGCNVQLACKHRELKGKLRKLPEDMEG